MNLEFVPETSPLLLQECKEFDFDNPPFDPKEFAQGTKGEVSAFYILLGYLEAELDRINRVKALPENSLERMVPVGKSTYGETGSKFTIFDDMLRPELKEELRYMSGKDLTTSGSNW